MGESIEELHRRALAYVLERYEIVAAVAKVDLEAVNGVRPESIRYRNRSDIVREFWSMAGAAANFAHHLGLITTEEAGSAITDFLARHPDLVDDLDDSSQPSLP